MTMKYAYILFLLCFCSFIACNDDDSDSQHAMDVDLIKTYLSDNNLTAQSTDSGLHYIIEKEGSGPHPTLADRVTVKYRGYLLDGTEFDATVGNQTFSGPLSGLIQGWQEGIPKFKAGGEGVLLIPSRLGYGSFPRDKIPANSVLIFDITLVSF